MMRVRDEECFVLATGERLCTLQELADALVEMGLFEYRHHVTKEKNDFAEWTEHSLQEPELAARLRKAATPQDAAEMINAFVRDAPDTPTVTGGELGREDESEAKEAIVGSAPVVAGSSPSGPVAHAEKKAEEPNRWKRRFKQDRNQDRMDVEEGSPEPRDAEAPVSAELEKEPLSVDEERAIGDGESFTSYHDAQAERLDKVADRFDAFMHEVEKNLEPTYPEFEKEYSMMQEMYDTVHQAISEARKKGKDPMIAALILRRVPSKLAYAKASKEKKDLADVKSLLDEVRKELNEELDRQEMSVKDEVAERTARLMKVKEVKGNTNKDAVEVLAAEEAKSRD